MGNDLSKKYDLTVKPQDPPISVIDHRFVFSSETTLCMLTKKWSGTVVSFNDQNSGDVIFNVIWEREKKFFSGSTTLKLLDSSGNPVFNYICGSYPFKISRGASKDDLAFEIHERSFTSTNHPVSIRNNATEQDLHLYFRSDSKRFAVFSGNPNEGGQVIACWTFRGPGKAKNTFRIAPGVDIALIVSIVLAYRDHFILSSSD